MVPINFHQYRDEIRRVLLAKKEALANDWDPFVAAWICYALAVDGSENNQPLSELRDRLLGWLETEDAWQYQRNLGPIATTLWLCHKTGQILKPAIAEQLSARVQQLNADEKWSPVRDGEQVFLLALGFQGTEDDQAKSHLKNIAARQIKRGPLRRRVLYAAAIRELGESVPCRDNNPQDEGDIIALVWWAERYGGDKHGQ